jgi:hypothetical protein
MGTPQTEHTKPIRLARNALQAAVDQKWKTTASQLTRLNTECDSDGLGLAILAWCDMFLDYADPGCLSRAGRRVQLTQWDTHNPVEPEAVVKTWVRAILESRANRDLHVFEKLLDEINALAPVDRGKYVVSLIDSIAQTIRTLPQGYVQMGANRGE